MQRNVIRLSAIGLLCSTLGLTACTDQTPSDNTSTTSAPKTTTEVVHVDRAKLAIFGGALPTVFESAGNPVTDAKIDLGRKLYYENRLSKAHDVSCNSCHLLDKYGVDGAATSTGHKKQKGGRNAPTVYHAAGHLAQFWDGRAKDVEEQAKGPILNPIEMAMPDAASVVTLLKTIPGYVEGFKKAFPDDADAVTYDNLGKAIGAFERKLATPSPFDHFHAGDDNALNADQKKGLNLFLETGCTTCHMGNLLGGMMYQKVGLVHPWPNQKDQGRFEDTKNDAEKMLFKVPSLRNIAKTGPYFHDGGTDSLAEAVRLMAHHQLDKKLDNGQIASLVAFLESLTGPLPTDYIKKPELPAGTDQTPKPATD